MALDGFCQHGGCKKPVVVRVSTTVPEIVERDPIKIVERQLDLCAEDAAYFLSFRDEKGQRERIRKFVEGCHNQ